LIDALLTAQTSSRPGHIVLLSDGHPATALPSQGTPDQLTTPVDTLILDPPKPRQSDSAALGSSPSPSGGGGGGGGLNISIQSVSAGPNALLDNTVNVTVNLLADTPFQTSGGAVPLTILDGSQIIATRTITWPAGRNAIRAELPMTPRRPGRWTYLAQLGSLPHESNLADNRAAFTLNVRSKPLVVVYVDGVLRWEGKFIRQALGDDPDIHVISMVRTTLGRGQLIAPADLANIDLVILGDLDATSLSSAESHALEHWVNTSGGAILLTGGYRSFGPNGFGRSNLRNILPVLFTADDQPQIEQPFSLKLTQTGREHPIFHLTGDTVRDAAFYQSLPPLAGCNRIAAVKPGAQVLAVNPNISSGAGGATSGGGGLPVMIEQQVGTGRTMVFAVDTTWRWRQVVGGFTGDRSFYQRFWGQLVRYLVRSPQATDSALSLTSDRDRADLGQPITLTASLAQGGHWRLAAHAIDERGHTTSLPLTDTGGGRYTATVTPVEPGRLDLFVRADPPPEVQNNQHTQPTPPGVPASAGMSNVGESQVLTVQIRPRDLEAGVTDIDRAWLTNVSGRTGGRTMLMSELNDWAKSLPAEPTTATANTTTNLWDHPALAMLFFTCLCVEWLLRRRSRLA
ncbi:MAG: glutamine amidotransferase, partial [Phycisphaeraceae bacterium]